MSRSSYIKGIRNSIGNSLLLVPSVAAVILDNNRRILLQEKANEAWSLPAGMIEPGETPKEAIIREVEEEAGLIVRPDKILGLFGGDRFRYVYPNGDRVEYQIVLFRCAVIDDIGVVADPESVSTRYFQKSDMPELALPYPNEVLFDECLEPYL